MGELVDRDQEHLRLLKLGFYGLAGISGFADYGCLMVLAGMIGVSAMLVLNRPSVKALFEETGLEPAIL